MNIPLKCGLRLPADEWMQVKLYAIFALHKWDIQSEDHCVLCDFPIIVTQDAWQEVTSSAERLTAELMSAEEELCTREDLLPHLGLSRDLRTALKQRGPCFNAVRVMRFDFHLTAKGWKISEVNCDVPGGFIEASDFTEAVGRFFPQYRPVPNTANAYADAIIHALGGVGYIGLVHATAYKDDREVMEFLADKFHARGCGTHLLSPAHIQWEDGTAHIDSKQLDALVRFFPAEWLPRLRATERWFPYFGSRTMMSNPASAVAVQSKRFPLIWNDLSVDLSEWRLRLPKTISSDSRSDAGDWILKPTFGRVGEGVSIPGISSPKELASAERDARRNPDNWIRQERFEPVPIETPQGRMYPCLGVYTVNGKAAGCYGRISQRPLIAHDAQDAAVLIGADR